MSLEDIVTALTFAVVLVSMLVTHNVADHWVQTDRQSQDKVLHGVHVRKGRMACLRHVASYTACTALVTGAMWAVFDLQISLFSFVAGQAISAVTHYWADRRTTLEGLVNWLGRTLIPGKGNLYRLGAPRADKDDNPSLGTGAYALDQAWHWWWIFVASVVTAVAA
ncbi:transcriptional regulator [Actinomadura scrupuli]|uniref:transcriptional regulator n=1 Tax=Actinomadura scrupuli TaxID=559629 RepID=UPI003D95F461